MENEKPLEKDLHDKQIEIPNQNPQNEQKSNKKDKKIQQKKINSKNVKEEKKEELMQNNDKLPEDNLDHPEPLLSDYYEEEKEEIKNEFYQNKLKEKKNNIYDKKEDNIKSNGPEFSLKKEKEINENKENKINNNNLFKENSNNEINSKENFKKFNPIIKAKSSKMPLKKIIKKKKKNMNKKIEETPFNDINNQKKEVPKNKEEKSKENSEDRNPFIQQSKNNEIKNSQNKFKIINKIKHSMNQNKDLIYKNSINHTLENESVPLPNFENLNQTLNQNSHIYINKIQNKKSYNQIKKKLIQSKLDGKSQSIDCIHINKMSHYSCSNLSKNNPLPSKVDNSINEKIIKNESYSGDNNVSPLKTQHHKTMNSNGYINKTFEKYKKINKIPLPINNDCLMKSEINSSRFYSNVKFYNIPKNNNYSSSNLCNKMKLNKIHNNNNFYQSSIDQKENFQNNSEFKKKTYDIGGKFNNVQTTYVVIAKNSNSKLVPKTIDYKNNNLLNSVQSSMPLKSSNINTQGQNLYLNTEQDIYQNRNTEYSHYKQNNSYVESLSTYQPKVYKSQNNILFKKGYNNTSSYSTLDKNNYVPNYNYNQFNKSSIYGNKSQTYNNKKLNYCSTNRSQSNRIDAFDTYDNCYYYNYGDTEIPNNTYIPHSMSNRYKY